MTFGSSHANIQHAFAANLLGDEAHVPLPVFRTSVARSVAAFAVYRNNVLLGLVRALAARFPTVARMLGDETFFAVAARFATEQPPRSPLLMTYGDRFPDFLQEIGRSRAAASFLSDIAAIEAAGTRAYHAADAKPLPQASFAALGGALAGSHVALHPSATLHRFATPAVTGWQINQTGSDGHLQAWHSEDALIARPGLDVGVWKLPVGAYDFLGALAACATVADAATIAAETRQGFDLAEALALLIASEIAVAIH